MQWCSLEQIDVIVWRSAMMRLYAMMQWCDDTIYNDSPDCCRNFYAARRYECLIYVSSRDDLLNNGLRASFNDAWWSVEKVNDT